MADERITAHKVTKPIQLLAAWLVGLCVVNGTFLTAATTISVDWLQGVLVVAAALNVPLFIAAIFLLQTKYRPEMQEDAFYAKYLDRKTNKYVEVSHSERDLIPLERIEAELLTLTRTMKTLEPGGQEAGLAKERDRLRTFPLGIAINDHLPWFKALRTDLKAEKFEIGEIFGAVNDTNPPEKFIVTIGDNLQGRPVVDLMRVLMKYDFDGIEFSDSRDEPDPSDVYVGGYGFQRGYAPVSDELRKLLEEDVDLIDLQHYVRTHHSGSPPE